MIKGYKYRIYPNKKQEELIQKTFGCCRFIYNHTLSYRQELYKGKQENMNKFSCNNYVNQVLKKKYEWLKEVDKFALTNSVWNMDNAYQKFFKEHKGFPKFKSKKHNRKSYTTDFSNNNIKVSFENNNVKLPKLKWIKSKLHRRFDGKIKKATILQTPSGKYFVSFVIDTEHIPIKSVGGIIGIDLGVKDLLVTSNGDKINNIRTTKKYEKKLAKGQRSLSRKVKGSRNFNKQRIKVAKIHKKIHNTRIDHLHKISHKLINENQVIVSEDLSVSNMVENSSFSKHILDCGWYELTRQISYKAEWNNRQYIKIDRFAKTSQICNICGYVNPEVKDLSVREWVCHNCNSTHDRDINAAKNILKKGINKINKTAGTAGLACVNLSIKDIEQEAHRL